MVKGRQITATLVDIAPSRRFMVGHLALKMNGIRFPTISIRMRSAEVWGWVSLLVNIP